MSAIRIFTDEDVYGAISGALRRAGVDALSTPEAGRLHESDESQLLFAASQDRALVTFNVAHFAARHAEWLRSGKSHAGIIVSRQRSIGEVLSRLLNLVKTLDAESMHNRLEFLSDW